MVADKTWRLYLWHAPPGQVPEPLVFRSPGFPATDTRLDASERRVYAIDTAEQKLRVKDLSAWPDARPLHLRRGASWWLSAADVHPSGNWVTASTSTFTHLTFWPLPRQAPVFVDGYRIFQRPVVFSPDSRWLATTWADGRIRLWPLPGSGTNEVRTPELPPGQQWLPVMFDRGGRFLLVTAAFLRALALVPLDGTPARAVVAGARAMSPSGRLVAGAFLMEAAGGQKERTLWVSDVESGETRHFALPATEPSQDRAIGSPEMAKAYGGGIARLAFADESTIYTVDVGGLRRWNVETGAHEAVTAAPPGSGLVASFSDDARTALLTHQREGNPLRCQQLLVYDTRAGTSRQPPAWAVCDEVQGVKPAGVSGANAVIDGSGSVAAFNSRDGSVRVGRLDAAAPHLLVGHKGPVQYLAISPDLRWVATAG